MLDIGVAELDTAGHSTQTEGDCMSESIQTLDSWAQKSFPGRQHFTHVTIH